MSNVSVTTWDVIDNHVYYAIQFNDGNKKLKKRFGDFFSLYTSLQSTKDWSKLNQRFPLRWLKFFVTINRIEERIVCFNALVKAITVADLSSKGRNIVDKFFGVGLMTSTVKILHAYIFHHTGNWTV